MAPTTSEIIAAVDAGHETARADLEALCRIPSIAFDGFDPAPVHESARATAELLERSGLQDVRLLEGGGAPPAVFGEVHVGDDRPTVLLYAHHDVQPTGDVDAWTSPPFEPTERDGRLYGRGCADDKAGVVAHATAVAAWNQLGGPPVNVKVIIEGEEEIGSPHLEEFLAEHGALLAADAVVVADLVNWKVGTPSLTYLLRGMVDVGVEIRVLEHAVHSGMYGGPVPDPLTALAKLIADLTDETGALVNPELRKGLRSPSAEEMRRLEALDFDEGRFRGEASLGADVRLGGDPGLPALQKIWMEPNLTVLGIDAPSVQLASNAIQPSARAKLGLRLGPGQDAKVARQALVDHLNAQSPMGLEVTATPGAAGDPFETELDRAPVRAMLAALEKGYGAAPVLMGSGGSIPLLGPLQTANPDATMLLLGVEDPDSRAHGIDESLHLGDWKAACRSVALLFAELAG
ncbi:M20/M25/M40 family metallo-hydrolase [Euzebya rosea]|uniref:M20/M25/M40 family metallo-hydrolase n=1 Tax=Euzebya rosea TaxID=2052804 RepID=UPI000D3EA128|nr:M20/M25/M40 family metallo-hydrolase [Euzebya rosea]